MNEANLDLSKYKILIADDCIENFRIYDFYLRNTNAQIKFAENGLEAVKMASEFNFDLFIFDIEMPEMNGIEALNHLKSENPNHKILAMSAYEEDSWPETNNPFKFDDYIKKPVDKKLLISKVNEFLSKIT